MIDLLIDHRALLFLLPLTLLPTASIVVAVWGEHMGGPHGRDYRAGVLVCLLASFLALAVIAAESLYV